MSMTETEAIEYAASWGSYMNGEDPGACMYGFCPDIGLKVQSEQHRANCLEWIECCKGKVDPDNNDAHEEEDFDKLSELAKMIKVAPLTHN